MRRANRTVVFVSLPVKVDERYSKLQRLYNHAPCVAGLQGRLERT